LDIQENVVREVWKMHLWSAGSSSAKRVCFANLNKELFLKSKMQPVDKYGVYWDILLRVAIYVTKCIFFNENLVNHKICQELLLGSQKAT